MASEERPRIRSEDFAGKTLQRDTLTPKCAAAFSYFEDLGPDHAAVVIPEGSGIDFVWLDDASIYAVASWNRNAGRPEVGISYGTPLVFLEAFDGLFASPDFAAGVGGEADPRALREPVPEHLGKRTRLNESEPVYWRLSDNLDRHRLARQIAEISFHAVLHHEFAHVICQHVSDDSVRLYFEDSTDEASSWERCENRFLEIEADWVGTSLAYQRVWRSFFTDSPDAKYFSLLYFGTAVAFALIDGAGYELRYSKYESHPHPVHRLFSAFDSLSATLNQIGGISVADVRAARQDGLALLLRNAANLGLPPERWATPDTAPWSVDDYESERDDFRDYLRKKYGSATLRFGDFTAPSVSSH